MKELAIDHNGKICTSSRLMAEVFKKEHKNILRAIEKLECSEEFNRLNFERVDYTDNKGEKRPRYIITRDGFSLLAMSFTGKKAARFKEAFLEAFGKMERALRSVSPASLSKMDILKMAIESEKEKERLKKQNEELKGKALLFDKIVDDDKKLDMGQAAKILGLPYGRNILFQKLRERGVFFKTKNEPKQIYVSKGYFMLKERFIQPDDHEGFVALKALVTQKGLAFLAHLLGAERSKEKRTLFRGLSYNKSVL